LKANGHFQRRVHEALGKKGTFIARRKQGNLYASVFRNEIYCCLTCFRYSVTVGCFGGVFSLAPYSQAVTDDGSFGICSCVGEIGLLLASCSPVTKEELALKLMFPTAEEVAARPDENL